MHIIALIYTKYEQTNILNDYIFSSTIAGLNSVKARLKRTRYYTKQSAKIDLNLGQTDCYL